MNVIEQIIKNKYAIWNGDSVEIVKDIPDNSLAVGNPCKVIRRI